MKKTLLIFSFLILAMFKSYAQYLSLDELINLRGKDADAVNNYLSSKGWAFSGASEETEDNYSYSTWAYGKQLYTGRAKSFCKLMTADGYYNKVTYTTISKDFYNLIKSKIVAYKMVKMSSTPKDGYLVTVYVGNNYVVETSLATDAETSIPVYAVIVSKRTKIIPADELTDDVATKQENADETQENNEVLQENQIESYKKLMNGIYAQEPSASDFIFMAEPVSASCELTSNISGGDTMNNIYRRVSTGAFVYVLSCLPKENHEYFLVYTGGYYGYIKSSELKRYSH